MNKSSRHKKPYRPSLACRTSQEVYDNVIALAERRIEAVSNVVETAIKEYIEKVKALEHSYIGKD